MFKSKYMAKGNKAANLLQTMNLKNDLYCKTVSNSYISIMPFSKTVFLVLSFNLKSS